MLTCCRRRTFWVVVSRAGAGQVITVRKPWVARTRQLPQSAKQAPRPFQSGGHRHAPIGPQLPSR
jgi:hypothetical protein